MGATEAEATGELAFGRLGGGEAAAGLALSDAAGWNQSEADWRLFLRDGEVLAARDVAGRVVATAALLPYPPAAWISLVLVHADWRRRGLASALMARCLALADARRLACWLDATPAGATVYGPLGFEVVGDLARLRRKAMVGFSAGESSAASLPAAGAGDIAALIASDEAAFGFSRAAMLTDMAARNGSQIHRQGGAIALARDGRKARQFGPLHAPDEAAAAALVDDVLATEPGELVIDLPAERKALRQHLMQRGFAEERSFLRMVRGGAPTPGIGRAFMAGAGPEYG